MARSSGLNPPHLPWNTTKSMADDPEFFKTNDQSKHIKRFARGWETWSPSVRASMKHPDNPVRHTKETKK